MQAAIFQLKKIWWNWLSARTPVQSRVTLDQRRIYILPTTTGFVWLGTALLIFILAANYGNSLAFGLTFFMVSLFMLSIFHTWRNLEGLTVSGAPCESVYAGEDLKVNLQLSSGSRERMAIRLGWAESEQASVSFEGNQSVGLLYPTRRRGYLKAERFKVESVYPLGFCRTWSWVHLDIRALVYPKPDYSLSLPLTGEGTDDEGISQTSGLDQFIGSRKYQLTDSPSQVDWRSYARTLELNTKLFESPMGNELGFVLERTPGASLEQQLSILTGWILLCEEKLRPYSLELSAQQKTSVGLGRHHLTTCLEMLARYGLEPGQKGG